MLIPQAEAVPGAEVLVSANTGLIGVPEQTQDGVSFTTLLNPSIKIGQAIRLQATVNQYRYGVSLDDAKNNPRIAMQNKLNPNGLYYVMRADHSGDTRGNDWYTHVTALSIDATLVSLDLVQPPSSLIPKRS